MCFCLLQDVHHFQMFPGGVWYHTKFRPGTKKFLMEISKYYELHIVTYGEALSVSIAAFK